jgi:hypothetical protein
LTGGQVTRREATAGTPAEVVTSRAVLVSRSGGAAVEAVTRDIVRRAAARDVAPLALSGFSLGFAAIGAVWLTGVTAHADIVALVALVASFFTCRAGRLYARHAYAETRTAAGGHATSTPRMVAMALMPSTDWAQGACALLAELAVYTGIAVGVSVNSGAAGSGAAVGLAGPVGNLLRPTMVATIGGSGSGGVWLLAIAAAILLAVREMANLCVSAAKTRTAMISGQEAARRILVPAPPSGIRLVLLALTAMIAGARPAFGLAFVLGAAALLLRATMPAHGSGIIGYRGDGPLSVWIGGFVDGRLPPVPPVLVGLMVTGALTVSGLGKLPGILVFVPDEAMLLGALGCWHRHDGPRDWLVPALLQTGEYVFLAALGFAFHAWPPVIFALLAAVALRHSDLAYRARNQVSPGWFMRAGASVGRTPLLPGADWRGLGWEGRMIVAAFAAESGVLPYAYVAFAAYLWFLLVHEALTGWSAGHSG